MSQSQPDYDLKDFEARLVEAALNHVGRVGFHPPLVACIAHDLKIDADQFALACPNGARDVCALIYRHFDDQIQTESFKDQLKDLKIREKIAVLVKTRLDLAFDDEALGRRMIGYLVLPMHIGLYHSLLWKSADIIWRLAGDQALDENHYSKRAIVSTMLSTAALTRMAQGKAAQDEQLDRNIDAVMAFELWKRGIQFDPGQSFLEIARQLGRFRFGQATPT